jgi:hypothetical protein
VVGMTTPSGPELVADTDPGPVPDEPPVPFSRSRAISAIHALADHIAAHADLPTPTSIILKTSIDRGDEIDEATRVAPVLAFALEHPDAVVRENTYDVYAYMAIMRRAEGAPIDAHLLYSAILDNDNPQTGRYVR